MHLILTPQRRDTRLELRRDGDVLTLNGEAFDFSVVPDGATLPREAIASDWFGGSVERIDGALYIPLIVPHGREAPAATRAPKPLHITADGPIALPPYALEEAAK